MSSTLAPDMVVEPAKAGFLLDQDEDHEYVELDKQVDGAESVGVAARWEFGSKLLAERVGKKLPPGRMNKLCEKTGKSRTELSNRVQFAEQGREALSNALDNGLSWFEICKNLGKRNKREPGEFTPEAFDVWSFQDDEEENPTGIFGKMPLQVAKNILHFWSDPGDVVVDPFAGSGTTVRAGERMERQVFASDANPRVNSIPKHNILDGWPADTPDADLIVLDPPYWVQAKERYSKDPRDLGNVSLDMFLECWRSILYTCSNHLNDSGHIAYIISPAETDDGVVDLAMLMLDVAKSAGLSLVRRVIVTYTTQQATGQQVNWARANRKMLKRYRDLVVLTP